MQWRVQCFAGLRELIGRPEFLIDLPGGATAGDLKRAVEEQYPALTGRMGAVRVAAANDFLDDTQSLPDGTDLALIPPVSGGSDAARTTRLVTLSAEALDPARVCDLVRGSDAGAIATFIGTVRGTSKGRTVLHLEYEVYPAMALDRMERIARQALETTGALRVAVVHRTGRVPVGEDSVVIAAAAAHRDEAFAACRLVIEALKADVPIWKKEVYEKGEAWVGWGS
jgi:molybdopterin synthase catalytic subunit/molybdopterin converting factor small subunit